MQCSLARPSALCLLLPLSAKTTSVLSLYRSCAYCRNLCESICTSVLLNQEDSFFFLSHPFPLALTIFLPLILQRALSLEGGEGIYDDIPFRTEYFKVSHSLPIFQLWIYLLITIFSSKNLL